MLVLQRDIGSTIRIGSNVRVVVRAIRGRRGVKLGIDAPDDVPILREELVDQARCAAPTVGTRSRAEPLEVCLIEDDPAHRELIALALAHHGVGRLEAFSTGHEGVEGVGQWIRATSSGRHLILLDLGLPDMSGLDVLAALRRRRLSRGVPVVVLTSSQSEEDVSRCLSHGANAFLEKAATFDDLEESLGSLVEFFARSRLSA